MSEYSESRVSKTVKLNLSNVDIRDWDTVKREVGEFIVDSILDRVADGKSPVHNQRNFKRLNADYARKFKGGDRTANLDLRGFMLDSLEFELKPNDELEVGVFDPGEAPKALGHNTGALGTTTARRDLVRRFIPRDSQRFDNDITSGIKDIVSGFEREQEPEADSILSAAITAFNVRENVNFENPLESFVAEFVDGEN